MPRTESKIGRRSKFESTKTFANRKVDHIRLSLDERSQALSTNGFDQIRLVHNPLPEIRFSDVNLSTTLLGRSYKAPFFISSMTAGHGKSKSVNSRFAKVAAEKGWLMCVGSQKRELFDPAAAQEWKQIKKSSPGVSLISNIGIEEVIQHAPEKILKILDAIEPVGLIVHLNSIQEVFQKQFKGDLNLRGGLKAIESLVRLSPVPIIVKEVGFGFSMDSIRRLENVGVKAIDLSGRGGSHWAMIEALRVSGGSGKRLLQSAQAFSQWGYTNIEMLLQLQENNSKNRTAKLQIWSSGGIRNGVDALKCLTLGANAVGIAQPLMAACLKNENSLLNVMEDFENQLKVGMFAMGVVDLNQLHQGKYWYE